MFENKNNVANTCLLCGEALKGDKSQNNEEHIFSKWAPKKYGILGKGSKYIGIKNRGTDFGQVKVPVHKKCNSLFGDKLEQRMRAGDYNEHELWLWIMKFVCGLKFHEVRMFNYEPENKLNIFEDRYSDDFNHFWSNYLYILNDRTAHYHLPYTIIELESIFNEDRFSHFIHLELGIVWLVLGDRCFLIFFRQILDRESKAGWLEYWERCKSEAGDVETESDIEFLYRRFYANTAIDTYFQYRGQYWTPDMPKLEFNRPAKSVELEDQFYSDFSIKPHRDLDQEIIGFMTVNRSC